ncbi:hypothetical protein JXM83_04665 [Candidatus Woesearchaeota archaeon]|nr:hypothetical protein [Candidatus Woesearchaeota archaeon]
MFRPKIRKPTFFEKLLMFLCFGVGAAGYFFINKIYLAEGKMLSWEMVIAMFLWLILIFVIIQSSIAEDQKEELGLIFKEEILQTKLLQDLTKEQNEEIKLLRKDLIAIHTGEYSKKTSKRK